jgi:hypothetical protein
MDFNKSNAVAVVALVIAIAACFLPILPNEGTIAGAVGTRFPNGLAVGSTASVTQNKLTVGNSGTAVAGVNFGTCNLDSGSGAFGAFQTKAIDCGGGSLGETALTGITAGDNVSIIMPTTTPASLNSIVITGVAASSTAGFITVSLTNASSSAVTLTSAATTSLQYRAVR